MSMNNLKYGFSLLGRHFLGISRIRDRLEIVVLQHDMPQFTVRHVLHVDPLHFELALPLILRPDARAGVVVDRRDHLSDTAEMTATVHRVEQIDRTHIHLLFERIVQFHVAVFGRTPDTVLDGSVGGKG